MFPDHEVILTKESNKEVQNMYDIAVIGGGIVGLSVAKALLEKYPEANLLLLEKENELAMHQTGHNSGVIHSGIYYKPGSFKATFARQGNRSMQQFCEEHDLPFEMCGKVIVATDEWELPHLENLYERGLQNQLNIEKLTKEELREFEPHVNGLAAILVKDAGIVNYKQVTEKMAEIIQKQGATVSLGSEVTYIDERNDEIVIGTSKGDFTAKFLVNCAGLYSDKIAELAGYKIDMQIVPFRGEYYKLKPEKRYLVKNLIYPVPNPKLPFLGVHFTRMINGEVEAGPNAILSLQREGYKKFAINFKELSEVLTYKGFWKLAKDFGKEGVFEYSRSLSKTLFTHSLQKLIPEVRKEDLEVAPAGVRAQALGEDGKLVDDFKIIEGIHSIHVCNAPSPAATASIEIGKEVARRVSLAFAKKIVSISK